ncbi:hypothetical protein AVEN_60199-1 [Araneus ventricosus]|uniref:DNA helicase Pif1-like 2B domain-containing protein n=1 Tax=Araneus ventricosus TaxID=182803 RepID=A0A4Y2CM40_ARAVE|nr:hypothetical protein AVEN_60199-1 [Araneus ventricosus]
MNKQLLQELPGSVQVYKSIDTTCDINEAVNYPTKFLNTMDPPRVPSHTLEIKIGALIILLRNINPPSICSRTRLFIKKLMLNIIEATINTAVFSMSINKAQGQSLNVVGLDLLKPCFSHGQLYVGCSRVGKPDNLYILAPNGITVKIMHPEALERNISRKKR